MTPASYLRSIFVSRRRGNPRYSNRAFARDLGMSQSLLSFVLNQKRHLSIQQATQISVLLDLDREESAKFMRMTVLSLPSHNNAFRKLKARAANDEMESGVVLLEIEKFRAVS